MGYNESMTALADAVRAKSGATGKLTVDQMTEAVNGITSGSGESSGGTDTSDATVTADKLLKGVTAYGADGKVTGEIETVTPTLTDNVFTVPSGFIAEPKTLTVPESGELSVSENIVTVNKGYQSEHRQITVGTAKAAATITPGTANQTIATGTYLTGTQTIKGDGNLTPENIKEGVAIFGVSGSFTGGGGGVNRLYISSGGGPDNRLFSELGGSFNTGTIQVPARRGVYNDIHAANGNLWYARNGEIGEFRYRSRKISSDVGWTLARGGLAVKGGELYAINGDPGSGDLSFSLFPDSPSNVTQLGFSYDGRRWCLAGYTAYIMSPHAGECKPAALSGVSVRKLLNQGMGTGWEQTYSQAAISSSGRAILLWGEHISDGEPQAAHFEYVGNDESFVNYFYKEYEDDGGGGGTYRLALKEDGTLYAQDASAIGNSWNLVSGAPKFRTNNFLGFCAYSMQEDWETGETKYVDSTVALHIATDGTLWKIRASSSGVFVTQLDDHTGWSYVPPELGRDSRSYAQCDGVLYVIESDSSDTMNITWRECYIQPSGKLIATSHDDSFLWFAEEGAEVDVTGLGVL